MLDSEATFPSEFTVRVGDPVFTAEDYPRLRAEYGKHLVLMGRAGADLVAVVTTVAIVRYGVLARFIKAVPAGLALERLDADDADYFQGREDVLVCAAPADWNQTMMLASMATSEEEFFATKRAQIESLDLVLALDLERITAIIEDAIRYLGAAKAAFISRDNEIAPPTSDWDIYVAGAGTAAIPSTDRVSLVIKAFASRSMRVCPRLPEMSASEVEALFAVRERLLAMAANVRARIDGMPPESETLQVPRVTTHRDWRDARQRRRSQCKERSDALTKELSGAVTEEEELRVILGTFDAQSTPISERNMLIDQESQLRTLEWRLMIEALSSPIFAGLAHGIIPNRLEVRKSWHAFGPQLLQYFLAEEFTRATYRAARSESGRVTGASPFVFTLDEVLALGVNNAPASVAEATKRLDIFVGGYLADLDLSRTFITGSSIAASLIVTNVERGEFGCHTRHSDNRSPSLRLRDYTKYIRSLYPTLRTTPRNLKDYHQVLAVATCAHFMKPSPQKETMPQVIVMKEGSEYVADVSVLYTTTNDPTPTLFHATLDIRGGADVDMAVDVETNEEFDRIARQHYETIRAKWPCAVLTKVPRSVDDPTDPRHNWAVTWDPSIDPTLANVARLSEFRSVEIYRASFDHIVTHHVGMVSGAYTAAFGSPPQFYMSARLVSSMANLATPNYYYFASRKTTPLDVILKYRARGFGLDAFPTGIRRAVEAVAGLDPVWGKNWAEGCNYYNSEKYPALSAIGLFSAFALPDELISIKPHFAKKQGEADSDDTDDADDAAVPISAAPIPVVATPIPVVATPIPVVATPIPVVATAATTHPLQTDDSDDAQPMDEPRSGGF
ncbi:MAG: hypothetical protein WC700_07685 [Gemmatimonadaceae bacterium]|jgi:hypothetical protein